MKKHLISILFVLVMLLTLIPMAFAEKLDEDIVIVEALTEDATCECIDAPSEVPVIDFNSEWDAAADHSEEQIRPEKTVQEIAEQYLPKDEQTSIIASGKCGESAYWSLDNTGILRISGTGAIQDYGTIDIPIDPENPYIVRQVIYGDPPWLAYANQATSLVIDKGITQIGQVNFQYMEKLTSVSFPKGLKSIGKRAFDGCEELKSIVFPAGMTSIGEESFSYCNKLSTVNMPDGLTDIAYGAFAYCPELRTVRLPSDLTDIPVRMFEGSFALERIDIPSRVKSIGDKAFYASGLKSITLPEGLLGIGNEAFCGTHLSTIDLPDSLTWIGESCFSICWELERVEIPDNITNLTWTFSGCLELKEVKLPANINGMYGAFSGCSSLKSIELPVGLEYIHNMCFNDCDLTEIAIPATVREITASSFDQNYNLKKIAFLGNAPDFIAENAFSCVEATAYYPAHNSTWTDEVRQNYGGTITWEAVEPLPAPVLTEAFNSATGVRVSWQAVDGAAKYQLLRKNVTLGETRWKVVGETADCSLIDTTAKSSNRYTYSVKAVNIVGVAGPCDETGRTCTYIAKADITNLRYGSNGVSITWSKPAGAKNFRVMRREDGTGKWTVLAVIEGTTYTDTTAKIGTKYWYTVRGVSMDNKVVINSYNGTGWSIKPVSAPVLTEAFNSATGVRVSWKAVNGAAKYRLLRKNLTKGETTWSAVGETKDCTLIDTTAASASRYTYTVECVDSNGRTCSTSDSTGRTCTFIALAKITSIKSASNGVALEWSKPAGAKNFRILRKADGGSWVKLTDIQGTSYTDTTAKVGVKYWYTVRAITLAGDMYINSYNATGWSVTRK